MKTAHKGEVKFHVMSLKEPDEANEEGLKVALEPSLMKLRVNIKRKNREKCTLVRGCSCTFVPSGIVPRGMYTYFHEWKIAFCNCKKHVLALNSFLKKYCFACINLLLRKFAKTSRLNVINNLFYFFYKVVMIFFESWPLGSFREYESKSFRIFPN